MFTPEDRARLRAAVLDRARFDGRITAAAITGSAAEDREDAWSDIDLAFAFTGELQPVLEDWTRHLYENGAVDHVDVPAGPWLYRVFLLADTLQIDLAFVPAAEFRPLGPTFRVVFGHPNEPRHIPAPGAADLAGWAWLYALHARSAIARGKFWQAEYMISGVRDHALALACVRHGVPAVHGKGMDQLPPEVTAKFEAALVGRLDAEHLRAAFDAALSGLIEEVENEALAGTLVRLRS